LNPGGEPINNPARCTCYHPLFCFNQFGEVERAMLREGNVHSADDWPLVPDEPVVARYRDEELEQSFRGDLGQAASGCSQDRMAPRRVVPFASVSSSRTCGGGRRGSWGSTTSAGWQSSGSRKASTRWTGRDSRVTTFTTGSTAPA